MISKKYFGLGAIAIGALIAITQVLNLPSMLNYLWAAVAIVWGILVAIKK